MKPSHLVVGLTVVGLAAQVLVDRDKYKQLANKLFSSKPQSAPRLTERQQAVREHVEQVEERPRTAWPEIDAAQARVLTKIVSGRAYLSTEIEKHVRFAIMGFSAEQVGPQVWMLVPLSATHPRASDIISACEKTRTPLALTLTVSALTHADYPVQLVSGDEALTLAKPGGPWALWPADVADEERVPVKNEASDAPDIVAEVH